MRFRHAVLSTALLLLVAAPAAEAGIWTPLATPPGTGDIRAVEYQSESRLWFATADGQIFRRLPDGSFAAATMVGGSSGVVFQDIEAQPGGDVVIAVGNVSGASTSNVWRSNDGGISFTRSTTPTVWHDQCGGTSAWGAFRNAYSVKFASTSVVYVSGDDANILASTDSGGTWTEVNRYGFDADCKVGNSGHSDSTVTDMAWINPNQGYFLTRLFGRVYETSDGLASNAADRGEHLITSAVVVRLAVDPTAPHRQWAVTPDLDGDVSATADEWNTELSFENGGLQMARDGAGPRNPRDVAGVGGTAVIVGPAGQIATSPDGTTFHNQRADGTLETRDWFAVDGYDTSHFAVGGVGGSLVVTAAANSVPPEPPSTATPPGSGTSGSGATGTGADTTAPLPDFAGFGATSSGASVTVGCAPSEAQGCRVTAKLTSRKKLKLGKRGKAKVTVLGSAKYTLKAGQRLKVRIPLSSTGKRLLKKYKRLSARADLAIADVAGNEAKASQVLTLKYKKPKRGRR